MIIYQVTLQIDPDCETDWLTYMKNEHIPDVMETGLMLSFQMQRSMSRKFTYVIRYEMKSMTQYDAYQSIHAKELQADHSSKFEGKFTASRELLELI